MRLGAAPVASVWPAGCVTMPGASGSSGYGSNSHLVWITRAANDPGYR